MAKLILTTVGTSIIENYLSRPENSPERRFFDQEIEGKKANQECNKEIIGFTDMIKKFVAKNYNTEIDRPSTETKSLSAEIISLHIMQKNDLIDSNDIIVLLYSDTLEGKLASDINKKILSEKSGFNNVEEQNLKGVKGRDAASFTEAVNSRSITRVLNNIIARISPDDCYINFSGGYKGLIPVISEFARSRENRIDMYCLFEKSNSLIKYKYNPQGEYNIDEIASR